MWSSYVFNFAIPISLKFRDEIETIISFDGLMEDDASVVLELTCLVSNLRKEVARVFTSFLSFLRKYEEKKTRNLLSFMLDLVFKSLSCVIIYQSYD